MRARPSRLWMRRVHFIRDVEEDVTMNTRIRQALFAMAVVPVVAIALLAVPAHAQQDEGIKVHGHWAIEVRNADGSLGSLTEFDNALQYGGAVKLAVILLRGDTEPLYWSIVLGGEGGPCVNDKEEQVDCVIGEPGNSSPVRKRTPKDWC